MRFFCLPLIFLLGFSGIPANKKQHLVYNNITITGIGHPNPGTQEYYEASFGYSVSSYANLTWNVTGGTIISQSINPTMTVWCIVEWDNAVGEGSLSIYDDVASSWGERTMDIGCVTADAGTDVAICSGGSTVIGNPGTSSYTYTWSPSIGLSNVNIPQPTANPTQTTTYTLNVRGPNLLQNGDFSLGNTGFQSDYLLLPNSLSGSGSGGYSICTNPSLVTNYSAACSTGDHTTGSGNMMMVDANVNSRFWFETVAVQPNTDYTFSFWVKSIYVALPWLSGFPRVPTLRAAINNQQVGNDQTLPWNGCAAWTQYEFTWNSGSSTQATIHLVGLSTETVGNDLVLDDLRFSKCASTDQVTVSVGSAAPTVSPAGPITYYNQYETPNSITLTASSSAGYQWYKNNVAIPGATSQTYTIDFIGLPSYTDYYKCVNPCGSSNIVTFNYVGCDEESDWPVAMDFYPPWPCTSTFTPVQLHAVSLGTGTVYTWWLEDGPLSPYTISSTGVLNYTGSTWAWDGVYTKSARNGEEVYMFHIFTVAQCRSRNPSATPVPAPLKAGLSPNPASTNVRIVSDEEIQKIEIFNQAGQVVKTVAGTRNVQMLVNVADLPSGFYICKLFGKTSEQALKLVISRK